MSNLDSWENDPSAQEEDLSRQTQQMNLNQGAPAAPRSFATFTPGASTFTPGAQTFTPGQQYGGYPQYQQGGYQQQYGGYNQGGYQQQYGYNQGGYQMPYQQQQQQYYQPQQAAAPVPAAPSAATGTLNKPVTTKEGAPKVLSIGGDAPVKTLSIGSSAPVKTLSIGGDAPVKSLSIPAAKKEEPKKAEEPKKEAVKKADAPKPTAAKTVAAKAIAKTDASKKGSATPDSGRSSPGSSAAVEKREIDAVEKEQAADVDEETLKEIYGKEHLNIIFIGHVDAGKSTLGGSILYATGMVDERTMEKNKKEAKEMGRETWYLSWALDLTKEERSKGKTVEVGRGYFETEKRKYSILDAPGHKTYVPHMIGGASQADVGILVISARKGEYETGFEKGGQTREHAMLAKTQGVNKLVVVINKMDDPTVNWSKERYDECTTKLAAFLKGTGYNLKTDVHFMPIAAQITAGIKDRIPQGMCPWYSGPSLLEYLDNMSSLERKVNAPFMMPINGKYRELGTMVEGKIEAGVVKKGMSLVVMPNREKVEVAALYGETEEELNIAQSGDQVRIRLRGVEEEDLFPGFVLCSPKRLVHCVTAFEAQIRILDLKSILSAGFNCVMHVHSAIEEVTFAALLHKLQKGTGRKSKLPPSHAKKGESIIARMEVIGGAGSVCVERFEDYAQLGRFTLRDQGQTIAIGKIIKLITNETTEA